MVNRCLRRGLLLALLLGSPAVLAGGLMDGLKLFGGSGADTHGVDVGRVVQSAGKAFGSTTPEEEDKVGREGSAVLLGAVPLLDNPPLQAYVNDVGRWVAMHTERPDLNWRFAVLDTPEINSFAAPGGYVFITKGLLGQLRSEAELAGVLAHECAHVIHHHYFNAVQKNARMDLAAELANAAVKSRQRAAMERIGRGFGELYARGLDKDDEYQADRMGVVIAARAGYDPYGLPALLQRLEARNPQDSSLAAAFKTHPPAAKRLEALQPTLERLDRYQGAELAGRFRRALGLAR